MTENWSLHLSHKKHLNSDILVIPVKFLFSRYPEIANSHIENWDLQIQMRTIKLRYSQVGITSGYRQPLCYAGCLRSVFQIHNETVSSLSYRWWSVAKYSHHKYRAWRFGVQVWAHNLRIYDAQNKYFNITFLINDPTLNCSDLINITYLNLMKHKSN